MARFRSTPEIIQMDEQRPLHTAVISVQPGVDIYDDYEEEDVLTVCTFCKYMIYVVVGVAIALGLCAFLSSMLKSEAQKACHCTIATHFPEQQTDAWSVNTFIATECTKDNEKRCQDACISLIMKNPKLFQDEKCKETHGEDDNKYMGTLYSRPCEKSMWQATNEIMIICCKDGKPYDCKTNNETMKIYS